MHFSPLLLAATAATGTAASIVARQVTNGTFEISNFIAEHVPYTDKATVNFTDSSPQLGLESASCTATETVHGDTIGNFSISECSGDADYLWGLYKNATTGLYNFEVIHPEATTYGGNYIFPASSDRFVHSRPKSKKVWERLVPPTNPFIMNVTGRGPAP